jgi:hypothetical protein
MTDDADIGHGFDFLRHDRSETPTAFATVGEIVEPNMPKLSRDVLDTTHSKSPERYREFIGGLKNAEEFSLTLNYKPSNAEVALMLEDFENPEPNKYKGIFPDETEWVFAALIVGLSPAIPVGDKMQLEVTFKPSGKPTITAGGGA